MIIIPAIDILEGRAVRLVEGDFASSVTYAEDPVALAKSLADAGTAWLHVVDLDGAKARHPVNTDLIRRMAADTRLKIQVGGGLRQTADFETLFDCGVHRVILGSITVSDPDQVAMWLARFGAERLVVAPDCRYRDGAYRVMVQGWRESSDVTLWEYLDRFAKMGARWVLITDIARDGRLEGPNHALYADVHERHPSLQLIASGGITTLDDLVGLKQSGASAAVVGKALYEGRFILGDALALMATDRA